MRIHKLRLYNFGLFRGQVEFDLLPREKYGKTRPVVLIGGKNGAGKTTILEAIRLCLYGPSIIGTRVSQRDYEDYLRSRIHRDEDALILNQSSSVALEFDHSELGESHRYLVERSWDSDGKRVKLNLTVNRDGNPIDELDHAHADDFLRDLIPPGVSQLYFFDGEKIQQLAESDDDDSAVSDAVRSLLGLDLVDRLGSDLQIYASRLQKSDNASTLEQELDSVNEELGRRQERLLQLRIKMDEAESNVKAISVKIASAEARISKEGGAFADVRTKLEDNRRRLSSSIEASENAIRRLAEGLLPFCFVKPLCERVLTQLKDEEIIEGWQSTTALIRGRINAVSNLAEQELSEIAELPFHLRREIASRITKLVEKVCDQPEDLPKKPLIHRLSADLRETVQQGLRTALEQTPKEAMQLVTELERLTRELQKTENALQQAPKEDQMKPLVDRINELHRELGAADAELRRSQGEYASEEGSIRELKGQRGKLSEKKEDTNAANEREQLVDRVAVVLQEYVQLLTADKAAELEQAVRRRFQQLWRKGDIVRRIDIEPKTFAISLYDRHDRIVQKKLLSAGEKQIYAISMLWGLAEVSRRPLPMVIDTPLGRLDSDHRTHLVHHYFPKASHQVVILSTDTEIDERYFNDLKPHLSHLYHLEFDATEGRTKVEERYFWKPKHSDLAHAT